jgi:hypothetical protein
MLSRAALLSGNAVCLLSALVLAACGGDNSGDRDSTGGTTSNTGGTTSMGGSSATGGTATTATGGSGGAGSALVPYPCDAKAYPVDNLTSTIDATGKWGDGKTYGGGAFTFGDGPDTDKNVDISVDYSGMAMHVTGKAATYTGFGLWFGPASGQTVPCIDAGTMYKGISFDISDTGGTVKEIKLSVQTHATAPIDVANKRGGCVYSSDDKKYSDCVYPGVTVPVPAGGGVVEVPWASFVGGKPDAPVDGKSLDGLQWQFPWADGMAEYAVDITIKDVKFY